MSQKPNISLLDTTQFLQEKFNREVSAVTLLKGGEWSQAYSFVHRGQKYVLKWCDSVEAFDKDAWAGSFSSPVLPIPKINQTGTELGKHFAISEFAEGKFIDTLSAAELAETLPALFELFDALRNTDLSTTTGFGYWDKKGHASHESWQAYLLDVKNDHPHQLTHGWYEQLKNSPLGTQSFQQIYSQLESLVNKCPEVRQLIHADLLNYNLLIRDHKISAVLDWQCSLYGDSLYDLAWFIFYTPWYPQFEQVQLGPKALAHFRAHATPIANLETRLLCYQLHIGLGSIAYNAFKQDWPAAREVAEYTLKIAQ